MSDGLRDTLTDLLRSGSTSNPALNRLLDDYSTYHAVLVATGACFVLSLSALTLFAWKRYRRCPRARGGGWSFERTTHFCFALLGDAVALVLTMIVAANLGNALHPRGGFAGVVDALGSPPAGTGTHELHQSFTMWLQSGTTSMPSLVASRIEDRLAWQQPKAIITGALLAVVAVLGVRVWRSLIARSRLRASSWTVRDRALLLIGSGTVAAFLLLMVMVIGNTQASVAPIVMTLQFG